MDLGLTGKTALVAAASQGLGAAIAMRLAEEGCVVEICSRSLHRAQAKAEEIEADTGAMVVGVEVDVADSASIRSWVDAAAERYGALDVVIPNAGGPAQGRFDDTSEEEWDRAYALLLRSAMAFASAAKPHMTSGGSVLYLTSGSVKEPKSILSMSTIFRAGVASLAKTLAADWAADGIRVNHLIPGRIATERLDELDGGAAERRGTSLQEVRDANAVAIPLGRYGLPSEFADAAAFLVSPRASYITGATLQVDGGALKSVV
jgi:3-oxoacyl-[acyl-carrier protein] reductase